MKFALDTLRSEELISSGDRIILFAEASDNSSQNAIVVYEC